MQVKRNFDEIYRQEVDPWNIGDATSDRYNLYYDLIKKYAGCNGVILDIGCGFGAFLSRFQNDFRKLIGIEICDAAIKKGKKSYPHIAFVRGSAGELEGVIGGTCDAIIFSDVICYLDESRKNAALKWIADHLDGGGLALIAAWCPGGQYLEFDELKRLVLKYFAIEHVDFLESKHAVFVVRKKRYLIAITVDYETWQPLPKGKTIDWDKDVFNPTDELLKICKQESVCLTIMAEMGEYFWLDKNDPQVSKKMAQQWQGAISAGHDVQLHLHPNWLPELGARYQQGKWIWDWQRAKLGDCAEDVVGIINRCKVELESILRQVDPAYQVTAFRAGAYGAQPFKRIYDALKVNGIYCDSSVYAGGISAERGYDYSLAFSSHQPYFANAYDPQLKAPPSEKDVVEIPIFTFSPGKRCFLDGSEGALFAERLLNYVEKKVRRIYTSEWYRREKRLKQILNNAYHRLKPLRPRVNHLLPRSLAHYLTNYGSETSVGHEYFVVIGHTKAELHFSAISHNLSKLKKDGRFEFVTLSEMATTARGELESSVSKNAKEEAIYQVKRESVSVLGSERNEAQSYYLQQGIPLDREKLLDLGCGAGYWSDRIVNLYPWIKVVGVDSGVDFIIHAKDHFSSDRVSFQVGDFANLSFSEKSFDCVYADNVLEHAYDVDATLSGIFRVLRIGGVLVAAIPSDASNPNRICDNHTWKTAPHDVRMRLENAGFVNISIKEMDVFRQLGMPPYPPSNDRMMFIKAWKRPREASPMERAVEAMAWVYQNLNPEETSEGTDPVQILSNGYAFCTGYSIVLGKLLQREGFQVKWVTMQAKNHPRGKGEEKVDSHEVIEVKVDSQEIILDPMTNTCIPHSLGELLKNPILAQEKKNPDERYIERSYRLYDTDFWYSRIHEYAVRSDVNERWVFQQK